VSHKLQKVKSFQVTGERDSWEHEGLTIMGEYVKYRSAMPTGVCISGCTVKELLQMPPALCSCMDLDGSLSKMEVCLSCVWFSSQFDWDACKVVDVALLMRQQWRKALPVNSKETQFV